MPATCLIANEELSRGINRFTCLADAEQHATTALATMPADLIRRLRMHVATFAAPDGSYIPFVYVRRARWIVLAFAEDHAFQLVYEREYDPQRPITVIERPQLCTTAKYAVISSTTFHRLIIAASHAMKSWRI